MNLLKICITGAIFFFEGHLLSAQTNLNIQNFNDNSNCFKVDAFYEFPKELQESSALIYTHDYFWTLNDGGNEPYLYAFDQPFQNDQASLKNQSSFIKLKVKMPFSNEDWEALASDSLYFYIGDFGNNLGNRRNLKIYKIKIEEVLKNKVELVDTITFTYPDQENFKRRRLHAFDCESMICIGDSLYLFSKNWSNLKSNVYKVSKQKGQQLCRAVKTLTPDFYVSDATLFNGSIYLCGYNYLGNQFIYKSNWLKGTTKKIDLKPAQIEGICIEKNEESENFSLYLTTEKRKSQPAGIFKMNLK